MNLNIQKVIIKWFVILVVVGAILVLASTVMLAISNEGNSLGEDVGDASITARVKTNLLWSADIDGAGTNVVTQLGKVTLRGSAETADLRELAGWIVRSTGGVDEVDNQLIIKQSVVRPL